jgi:hypothetical protein
LEPRLAAFASVRPALAEFASLPLFCRKHPTLGSDFQQGIVEKIFVRFGRASSLDGDSGG